MPVIPAVGLKAVVRLESGETWFGIRDDVFSEGLSRTLGHGDILSSNGTVAREHSDLVAKFNPPARLKDYGLGALYIWPSGEIWFSVEEGFEDENLGTIQPGDLLSDGGYIVYRNLQLVQAIRPRGGPRRLRPRRCVPHHRRVAAVNSTRHHRLRGKSEWPGPAPDLEELRARR
jgi:hypothetical protein